LPLIRIHFICILPTLAHFKETKTRSDNFTFFLEVDEHCAFSFHYPKLYQRNKREISQKELEKNNNVLFRRNISS